MTYKGLWRMAWMLVASIALSACESDGQGTPSISFDIPAGSNSIVTTDSAISLNGTAESPHPIDSVTWSSDQGPSGTAQGGDNWQIFSIGLSAGNNRITVTATDTAGNTNSRNLRIIRETADDTLTTTDGGPADTSETVGSPVLMYSYHSDLRNAAPAKGARIDRSAVHFYVVPSDSWRNSGIDHMAYYCCDSPGKEDGDSTKLAVSREPWSMVIDLSNFPSGAKRNIDLEANLKTGAVLKAEDFAFTMSTAAPGTNRSPSITGSPAGSVRSGNTYEFLPTAGDPDGDALSYSISNQPPWTEFDKLSGRLWGVPNDDDVGIHGDVVISVSDGKTSASMPAFSIEVASGTPTPPPVPATPPPASPPPATPPPATPPPATPPPATPPPATPPPATPPPATPPPATPPPATPPPATPPPATPPPATPPPAPPPSASNSDWTVSDSLPSLRNPTVIDVTSRSTTSYPMVGISCAGQIYRISLGDTQDAVIHMTGNQPLRYPLHVTGGRNVRLVGLHFDLVTQSGCGIGELPNIPASRHPNANIHPRVPGGMALRLQQSGVSFVEGLHIDVKGHEADCIVSRNPDDMSDSAAQSGRDVIIQNTYCSGVEGLGQSDIGDGVHGDFFQNQGSDILRRLVFENVSMRTSQEGIVIHGTNTLSGTKSLVIRRYDYTWDPRYVGDDTYERFGLAFDGWPGPDWTLEDIRIDDYRDGGDYLKIRDQRYGSFSSSVVERHPEIRSGLPAQGAFALPGRTGLNYTSPHGPIR